MSKYPKELTQSEAYAASRAEAIKLWERGFRPCEAHDLQQQDRVAYVKTDPFQFDRVGDLLFAAVHAVDLDPVARVVMVFHSGGSTEADWWDEVWRIPQGAVNDLTDEGW